MSRAASALIPLQMVFALSQTFKKYSLVASVEADSESKIWLTAELIYSALNNCVLNTKALNITQSLLAYSS